MKGILTGRTSAVLVGSCSIQSPTTHLTARIKFSDKGAVKIKVWEGMRPIGGHVCAVRPRGWVWDSALWHMRAQEARLESPLAWALPPTLYFLPFLNASRLSCASVPLLFRSPSTSWPVLCC